MRLRPIRNSDRWTGKSVLGKPCDLAGTAPLPALLIPECGKLNRLPSALAHSLLPLSLSQSNLPSPCLEREPRDCQVHFWRHATRRGGIERDGITQARVPRARWAWTRSCWTRRSPRRVPAAPACSSPSGVCTASSRQASTLEIDTSATNFDQGDDFALRSRECPQTVVSVPPLPSTPLRFSVREPRVVLGQG